MSLYQTKTEQGSLIGTDKGHYAVYKGIPYARPPVGALRFRSPQEPIAWQGVREARENPPISWQPDQERDSFYEKEFYRDDPSFSNRSEDCLYLNVWTPARKKEDRLPVMLWVHGGAFQQGFGHEKEFDGEEYCRRGILLVTIQYRLGIFGFFAHPWLENGDISLFLQDQLSALEWVYANIAAFGGDPQKITVAGQSAGAISVQALLCADLQKGRIHQAILQSGGGYGHLARRCRKREDMIRSGTEFTRHFHISSLKQLQETDPEKLLQMAVQWKFPYCPSGMEETSLYDASSRKVPCLLGSTRNDLGVTGEMLRKGIPSSLYVGDLEFARHYGRQGNCYLYFFGRELPGDSAGAFHSSELWYMFGTLNRSWRPFTEADLRLSQEMLDAWCRFVKTGHPGNCEEEWPAYRQNDPYIHFFE